MPPFSVSAPIICLADQIAKNDNDDDLFDLREQVRRDPERHYLLSLARDGDISDVRQAVAIIDALKKTKR